MSYWNVSPKDSSKNYLKVRRWDTYSKIIRKVLEINPSKILEIGIGNQLVNNIIKLLHYEIKGLDVDESLNPDILMDVRNNEIFCSFIFTFSAGC